VTYLDEVAELPGPETTSGVAELEGPQEVADLLEIGPYRVNLVDKILHTDNTVLSKVLLDDGVVGEGNALGERVGSVLDLSVTTLVDELADSL